MSIKNLVEMIKRNGLLASMPQLEELYQVAIENEQKLAESQREFRAADATIENLQMQVEKLAAELRAVEAIHNEAVFITDDRYEQCPSEVQKIIKSLAVMKIPAYQASLAEVRASAIEHAASERWGSGYVFDELNEFAAQLRKGVQS